MRVFVNHSVSFKRHSAALLATIIIPATIIALIYVGFLWLIEIRGLDYPLQRTLPDAFLYSWKMTAMYAFLLSILFSFTRIALHILGRNSGWIYPALAVASSVLIMKLGTDAASVSLMPMDIIVAVAIGAMIGGTYWRCAFQRS